ncbi:hypothetical protein BaRGS_00006770 [Batillaria attramentaria]|uniref:Uncharacterized protein n=1 Tax=Batillaria attramentaria TaxID=370345 RepID=A0ABD0LS52_9CAEN
MSNRQRATTDKAVEAADRATSPQPKLRQPCEQGNSKPSSPRRSESTKYTTEHPASVSASTSKSTEHSSESADTVQRSGCCLDTAVGAQSTTTVKEQDDGVNDKEGVSVSADYLHLQESGPAAELENTPGCIKSGKDASRGVCVEKMDGGVQVDAAVKAKELETVFSGGVRFSLRDKDQMRRPHSREFSTTGSEHKGIHSSERKICTGGENVSKTDTSAQVLRQFDVENRLNFVVNETVGFSCENVKRDPDAVHVVEDMHQYDASCSKQDRRKTSTTNIPRLRKETETEKSKIRKDDSKCKDGKYHKHNVGNHSHASRKQFSANTVDTRSAVTEEKQELIPEDSKQDRELSGQYHDQQAEEDVRGLGKCAERDERDHPSPFAVGRTVRPSGNRSRRGPHTHSVQEKDNTRSQISKRHHGLSTKSGTHPFAHESSKQPRKSYRDSIDDALPDKRGIQPDYDKDIQHKSFQNSDRKSIDALGPEKTPDGERPSKELSPKKENFMYKSTECKAGKDSLHDEAAKQVYDEPFVTSNRAKVMSVEACGTSNSKTSPRRSGLNSEGHLNKDVQEHDKYSRHSPDYRSTVRNREKRKTSESAEHEKKAQDRPEKSCDRTVNETAHEKNKNKPDEKDAGRDTQRHKRQTRTETASRENQERNRQSGKDTSPTLHIEMPRVGFQRDSRENSPGKRAKALKRNRHDPHEDGNDSDHCTSDRKQQRHEVSGRIHERVRKEPEFCSETTQSSPSHGSRNRSQKPLRGRASPEINERHADKYRERRDDDSPKRTDERSRHKLVESSKERERHKSGDRSLSHGILRESERFRRREDLHNEPKSRNQASATQSDDKPTSRSVHRENERCRRRVDSHNESRISSRESTKDNDKETDSSTPRCRRRMDSHNKSRSHSQASTADNDKETTSHTTRRLSEDTRETRRSAHDDSVHKKDTAGLFEASEQQDEQSRRNKASVPFRVDEEASQSSKQKLKIHKQPSEQTGEQEDKQSRRDKVSVQFRVDEEASQASKQKLKIQKQHSEQTGDQQDKQSRRDKISSVSLRVKVEAPKVSRQKLNSQEKPSEQTGDYQDKQSRRDNASHSLRVDQEAPQASKHKLKIHKEPSQQTGDPRSPGRNVHRRSQGCSVDSTNPSTDTLETSPEVRNVQRRRWRPLAKLTSEYDTHHRDDDASEHSSDSVPSKYRKCASQDKTFPYYNGQNVESGNVSRPVSLRLKSAILLVRKDSSKNDSSPDTASQFDRCFDKS